MRWARARSRSASAAYPPASISSRRTRARFGSPPSRGPARTSSRSGPGRWTAGSLGRPNDDGRGFVRNPRPSSSLVRARSSHALERPASNGVHDQRNYEQHKEDKEQDLGAAHRRAGDRGEAKQRGDQSDHQKSTGPAEHRRSPLGVSSIGVFAVQKQRLDGSPVPRMRITSSPLEALTAGGAKQLIR